MTELIIGVVLFMLGAVAGALFYRRHRDRIEKVAKEVAK